MNIISLNKLLSTTFVLALVANPMVIYADDEEHKNQTHVATTEIIWEQSVFGPEIWKVHGDLTKGGDHITYIKFAAGTVTPLHIHSADYVGIDITGTSRHRVVGRDGTNKLLPPGSHWMIKANQQHVSECLPGLECIMAIYQKEAFDFIPLGPSPFTDED